MEVNRRGFRRDTVGDEVFAIIALGQMDVE
jgi:hypothetical protein